MLEIHSIRHSWPEKPSFKVDRPIGTNEYVFLHFWEPFDITINAKVYKTSPHACIIYKPGTPQLFGCENASTQDWFRIIGNLDEIMDNLHLSFDTLYYPKNYDFITSLTRKMEIEYSAKKEYYKEICNSYLSELFIHLSREVSINQPQSSLNSQTREQLKLLRHRLCLEYDKKWNIAEMANLINLSPSYLYSAYKRFYGVSPMHDLISIRTQHARTLLNDSKKTVNEIAELLGYSSTSHFVRQFTKTEGISPLKYRQRNRLENRYRFK